MMVMSWLFSFWGEVEGNGGMVMYDNEFKAKENEI